MRKVAVFLSLMLVSSLLIEDAQAGWFRRIIRRIIRPICRWACPRVCTYYTGYGYICRFACSYLCGRKRREIRSSTAGHISPLSGDMSTFDLNDDFYLSITEFSLVNGEDSRAQDIEEVFKIADKNGDGLLSEEEFTSGPFVFTRKCIPEQDDDDDDDGESSTTEVPSTGATGDGNTGGNTGGGAATSGIERKRK